MLLKSFFPWGSNILGFTINSLGSALIDDHVSLSSHFGDLGALDVFVRASSKWWLPMEITWQLCCIDDLMSMLMLLCQRGRVQLEGPGRRTSSPNSSTSASCTIGNGNRRSTRLDWRLELVVVSVICRWVIMFFEGNHISSIRKQFSALWF